MPTSKNIIIACGGTGGHLFPGIAVAQELKSHGHQVTLLISEKKVDAQASQKYQNLDFVALPAIAKPPTLSPRMLPFLWKLYKTIGKCKKLLKEKNTHAVLGMGGFTSFPPIFAGKKLGLHTFIHDSNAIPGRSNLLTAKFCTKILLGLQEASTHFPGKETIITGTPVRGELDTIPSRNEAAATLGLNPEKPTLLVMGGSQGAQKLNTLITEAAKNTPWQILHLTGQADHQRITHLAKDQAHHHVLAFCHDMPSAYAIADFALMRSGASSLTELSILGLPSLLVPFPFATDDHQTANAHIFHQAGAAELIQEKNLTTEKLHTLLEKYLDPETRHQMANATRSLAVPNAAANIANVITAN